MSVCNQIEGGKLSVVCFASGSFAVPVVEALAAAPWVELRAVATNPDKCAGRKQELRACPAKVAALAAGAPVVECPRLKDNGDFVKAMAALSPDLFVVVDFGQLLPVELLAVPRKGAVNLHPSLLPRWRGASPLQWTLAAGDEKTGVTVLYVTKGMDSGDILAQEEASIDPDDTAESLGARLSKQGARMMMEVLGAFRRGTPPSRPQDPAGVTVANMLGHGDAVVDWRRTATEIRNRCRGFFPWPGSVACLPDGTPLKLLAVRVAEGNGGGAAPGSVLGCKGDALLVACGEGTVLALEQVQPAGKGAMSGAALVCGRRVAVGGCLGNGVAVEKPKQ